VSLALLPLNEATEADRAKRVAAACDGGTWMPAWLNAMSSWPRGVV
jgi:hypothetical protein